jgi:hypothetical protein
MNSPRLPGSSEDPWGNLVGETGVGGASLAVNAVDVAATRSAATTRRVGPSSRFDFNRDGMVNSLDLMTVRRAVFSTLAIAPPAALAAAPVVAGRVAEQVLGR